MNILKAKSYIEFEDITVTYGSNAVVNLSSMNATGIKVVIYKNNRIINTTIFNATDKILLNSLNAGNYTLELTTIVDDNHVKSSINSTFTVDKLNPEMVINVSDILYGEDLVVDVYLPSDATNNVSVFVNKNVV